MSDNEFKTANRGKPLSKIAEAHMDRLINQKAEPDVIKRAMILITSASQAERLLRDNIPGEANVYFSAAVIAGLMSEVSPAHLLAHFYETLRDALFLRRIHDAHFDEKLTEIESSEHHSAEFNFMMNDGDGKVH